MGSDMNPKYVWICFVTFWVAFEIYKDFMVDRDVYVQGGGLFGETCQFPIHRGVAIPSLEILVSDRLRRAIRQSAWLERRRLGDLSGNAGLEPAGG